MKEISSIDFPQHGEVFYFYGQALYREESTIALGSQACIAVVELSEYYRI
jgi:hypothetical protein